MKVSRKVFSLGLGLATLLSLPALSVQAQDSVVETQVDLITEAKTDLVAEAKLPDLSVSQNPALQGLKAPVFDIQPKDLLFKGLTGIQRQTETTRTDGCSRIQKGLTLSGGFLLIACEKLKAELPITLQDIAARKYMIEMENLGWKKDAANTKKSETKYMKTDATGCNRTMSVAVWTDRALNEPRLPTLTRKDYRQIVFIMGFDGKTCEHQYESVKAAARQ